MSHPFKVIIAGAGVSGLALANMFEAHNIDYLLLESHSAIVTQVGASIGVLPNGLRILDQIGLYEKVLEVVSKGPFIHYSYVRDASGAPLWISGGMSTHMEKRHGYQATFFDRKDLLKILYDNIHHKDQILTSKSVCDARLDNDGVTVICADGTEHRGAVLVGADGIHSKVRSLSYKLAESLEPGYFASQAWSKVPSFYRCHFGIAQHVPGWPMDEQHSVMGATHSQLIVPGPDGKVYWFLFDRLPKARYGDDIPRYSKEDEAFFREKHKDELVTQTHRLAELFDCSIASTLTSLHETVADKWFFGRIMLVGDAVHKPNPINGQGGNAALETCAELTNALDRMRAKNNGHLGRATVEDLTSAFSEVQRKRQDRAHLVVNKAHELQSMMAQENPRLANFILRHVAPLMGGEGTFCQFKEMLQGSSRLDRLPMPKRAHIIPWDDELPARPSSSKTSMIACISFNAVLGTMLVYPKTTNQNLSATTSLYRLSQLLSPILIWIVESQRLGNRVVALPLMVMIPFLALYFGPDLATAAVASLFSVLPTNMPTGRPVGVRFAGLLSPLMIAGFLLPFSTCLSRHLETFCIPNVSEYAPAFFIILILSVLCGLRAESGLEDAFASHKNSHTLANAHRDFCDDLLKSYENADLAHLHQAYKLAFMFQAVSHLVMVTTTLITEVDPLHTFFFLGTASLHLIQLATDLYAVWTLRRDGFITSYQTIRFGLIVGVGHTLLGPGAISAGTWMWREHVLSSVGIR